MNVVITGGGTGGHVFGGVAIAQEFQAQSRGTHILFVGSSGGLETRLVPKAGFELQTLKIGKLVGQSILKKFLTLFQIPFAVIQSMSILRRYKADCVIGVGGYAAGPCILAARILRIPVGVLEQNSVVGFTNRVAAALANQVFTAFEEIPEGIPKQKCVVTGNPTRSHLRANTKTESRPFAVFAFGGSQGAAGINKMMLEAAKALKGLGKEIPFIHQTGEKERANVAKAYQELGYPAEVHAFIDDMQAMYDRASLIICRAGSSTISELAATQKPAVFVPFPFAAGNHQEVNARILEKAGAAHVLLQTKNTGTELAALILKLQENPNNLKTMREAMARFHRPDAAKRIVDLMKTWVLTKPTHV